METLKLTIFDLRLTIALYPLWLNNERCVMENYLKLARFFVLRFVEYITDRRQKSEA
jgi:hypothetical protein